MICGKNSKHQHPKQGGEGLLLIVKWSTSYSQRSTSGKFRTMYSLDCNEWLRVICDTSTYMYTDKAKHPTSKPLDSYQWDVVGGSTNLGSIFIAFCHLLQAQGFFLFRASRHALLENVCDRYGLPTLLVTHCAVAYHILTFGLCGRGEFWSELMLMEWHGPSQLFIHTSSILFRAYEVEWLRPYLQYPCRPPPYTYNLY